MSTTRLYQLSSVQPHKSSQKARLHVPRAVQTSTSSLPGLSITYTTDKKRIDPDEIAQLLIRCAGDTPTQATDMSERCPPSTTTPTHDDIKRFQRRVARALNYSMVCVAAYAPERSLLPQLSPANRQHAVQNDLDWSNIWELAPGFLPVGRQVLVGFARASGDASLVATVHDVAVLPELQGRGIGSNLVKKICQQLDKMDIVDIGMVVRRGGLEEFFEKCQFGDDSEESVPMVLGELGMLEKRNRVDTLMREMVGNVRIKEGVLLRMAQDTEQSPHIGTMEVALDQRLVINCWSGPRCCSTSLMYAFAQRSDTNVIDEPLYGHYLTTIAPTAQRPYRHQVLAQQNCNGNEVVYKEILFPEDMNIPTSSRITYVKHMAKQRACLDSTILTGGSNGGHSSVVVKNFLLVRSPDAVVCSFAKVIGTVDIHETCYTSLLDLYSEIRSLHGTPPIVILSEDITSSPQETLEILCNALGIQFEERMLHWEAGPKEYDGCWAPWWYGRTHTSTGFERGADLKDVSSTIHNVLPPQLQALYEECVPIYDFLKSKALRPRHLKTSLPPPIHLSANMPVYDNTATIPLSHAFVPDPRNDNVIVGIRDGTSNTFHYLRRRDAKISVLDSGFMLGDGVWEGIRVRKGVLLFANAHFERLYEGAKAIDIDLGMDRHVLEELVVKTLEANGMVEYGDVHDAKTNIGARNTENHSNVHIRLMVTRGLKATPYQHPAVTIGLPTIVILPEYKRICAKASDSGSEKNIEGIRLFTVHVRRGPADVQDPSLNSHSKLNCIAACIQASKAGADEALMLDTRGFVATCNSTNFFIVRGNEVWTPFPQYQMAGITRGNVIQLCRDNDIPIFECDFSLTKVYSASEAFVTGTFGGLTPVKEIDGRTIGNGTREVTKRLQRLYEALCEREVARKRGHA